eukprot:scaffold10383_cov117-Isochrysis_galbana.AAC.8
MTPCEGQLQVPRGATQTSSPTARPTTPRRASTARSTCSRARQMRCSGQVFATLIATAAGLSCHVLPALAGGRVPPPSCAVDTSIEQEVQRRRNLAIISHPDAGKTTLTEKLLLYGGAIQQAGAVKAKGEQRRATSDFMELEQERGISISSTVLSYEYAGKQVNVLDTPGHQDFSEDTYRTLAAADNAVMLVDAAKGLEPQTRKLFEVARLRRLPLFTFINKLDRPSLSPYELIDQIEQEFGIACCPLLWPIGSGDRFKGVVERRTSLVHLFSRGERGKRAEETVVPIADPDLESLIGDAELYAQLMDDVRGSGTVWVCIGGRARPGLWVGDGWVCVAGGPGLS